MHTQNNCQIHLTLLLFSPCTQPNYLLVLWTFLYELKCSYFQSCARTESMVECWRFSRYCLVVVARCIFYRSNKITCILCMDVKLVKHFTRISNIKGSFLVFPHHPQEFVRFLSIYSTLSVGAEKPHKQISIYKRKNHHAYFCWVFGFFFICFPFFLSLPCIRNIEKSRVAVLQSSGYVCLCVLRLFCSLNGLVTRWCIYGSIETTTTYRNALHCRDEKPCLPITWWIYLIRLIGEKTTGNSI